MSPRLHHRQLWSLAHLTGADVLALVAAARALEGSDRFGVVHRPLAGRNIALLSRSPDDAAQAAFCRAAAELGAQVARIPFTGADAQDTAALLGRLYDAVDCEGLDTAFVERLEREAGVPVHNGLADAQHPAQALADLMAIQQRSAKPLAQTRACVLPGDADVQRVAALVHAAALVGMDLRVIAPRAAWPSAHGLLAARRHAQASGGRIEFGESDADARAGADVVLDMRAAADAETNRRYTQQAILLASLS